MLCVLLTLSLTRHFTLQLVSYMKENPDFAGSFEGMLAADLVKKLKSTRNPKSRQLVVPKGQRGLSRKR